MPAGILGPLIAALAKLLLPIAQLGRQLLATVFHPRVLSAVGFGTAGAFALVMATHIVLTLTVSLLVALGLGGWSEATAHVLVYGPPTTLAAAWAFTQTAPGVAAAIGAVGGALFGALR